MGLQPWPLFLDIQERGIAAAKLQLDTIQTTVSDSDSSATWRSGNAWFDDEMSKAVVCSGNGVIATANTGASHSGDTSVRNALCANALCLRVTPTGK